MCHDMNYSMPGKARVLSLHKFSLVLDEEVSLGISDHSSGEG